MIPAPGSRVRSAGIEIGVALAYAVLAVGATWPMARWMGARLAPAGDADACFVATMLEWGYGRLPHGLAGFWDPPFFFPTRGVASYSDPLLGLQWVYAPFRLLSGNPLSAYTLTFIAQFALCGYGAYRLARWLTRDPVASFFAGALFELLPQKVPHSAHLHIIALGFVPLTLLAIHRLLEAPGPARAALLAVLYAQVFAISVYQGAYVGVLCAGFALVMHPWKARSARPLAWCAGTLLACALVLLWLHLPLARTQRRGHLVRSLDENVALSARPADYLSPYGGAAASVLPFRPPRETHGERYCYLGIVPMVLAIAAIVDRRAPGHVHRYALVAAGTFVLSLGPYLVLAEGWPRLAPMPYLLLYETVPGFDALRVPARLSMFVGLLLVVPVAHGFSMLRRRWTPSRFGGLTLGAALVVAHWLDAWSLVYVAPVPFPTDADDPLYAALREKGDGRSALVEIPSRDWENAAAMHRALGHGYPIVNGYTSHAIPTHTPLFVELEEFPSPATMGALGRLRDGDVRVRYVIWRMTPGFEAAFHRARAAARSSPALSLLADTGSAVLLELRPREELFGPGSASAASRPWVPLSLERFDATGMKGALDAGALRVKFPGTMRARLPLRKGPFRVRISVRAVDFSGSLPPLRLHAFLEGEPILDRVLPWGVEVVAESSELEIRLPERYELRLDVAGTGPLGRRPPMFLWLTCVEVSAR